MMTRTTAACLMLLLGLTALGCGDRIFLDETAEDKDVQIVLDEAFTLKPGQLALFDEANLRIEFAVLRGDSRCPADVDCITSGQATVELHLKIEGESETALLMNIPGLVEQPFVSNVELAERGFLFKLIQLDPYPTSTLVADLDDYRAHLVVSVPEAE